MTGLVVAMDGPSGSGKSSASRGVARALGLRYLDTGAMYRAITWWMLERGRRPRRPAGDRRPGRATRSLTMGTDPDAPACAWTASTSPSPIRTSEVTAAVSAVSAVPEVRRAPGGRAA